MDYYVIQVITGSEEKFVAAVQGRLSGRAGRQKFVFLKRRLIIRRRGKIADDLQPLFPSYVFLETQGGVDPELFEACRRTENFCRFLRDNADVIPLGRNDVELVRHFMKFGPEIGASLVRFDENDRIVVIEGPLAGLEGNIIKVNRRKHRAKILVSFNNSSVTMDLAFEVLQKG